jgi:ribosomal protein S18 acetylase RimI-like enzyme
MVDVRVSEPADEPALLALDRATWSHLVTPAPAREEGSLFFDARTRPDDVLVAEVDGRVVGYLGLCQAIPLASHSHVLEVNGLAVHPRSQGAGVGRALLEKAKEQVRRRGARKLSLRVLAPNTSARRLYESCGFEVEGVLRGEFLLEGEAVDDVLMAWHPGGASWPSSSK